MNPIDKEELRIRFLGMRGRINERAAILQNCMIIVAVSYDRLFKAEIDRFHGSLMRL